MLETICRGNHRTDTAASKRTYSSQCDGFVTTRELGEGQEGPDDSRAEPADDMLVELKPGEVRFVRREHELEFVRSTNDRSMSSSVNVGVQNGRPGNPLHCGPETLAPLLDGSVEIVDVDDGAIDAPATGVAGVDDDR